MEKDGMEKEKNTIMKMNYNLMENILMVKKERKEKNSMLKVNYYLKENIWMK